MVMTMVQTDAPRCSTCQHTPLTLMVSAGSHIVRARLGCTCHSMVLYEDKEELETLSMEAGDSSEQTDARALIHDVRGRS